MTTPTQWREVPEAVMPARSGQKHVRSWQARYRRAVAALRAMPEIKLCQALFLASMLFGQLSLFHQAGIGLGHGFEMAAIAKNLAETGTYGNPFEPAVTGPTALAPPLYPLFLAALIKILRVHSVIVFTVMLANILVNALIAALMPRLSRVFYGDLVPGALGAVLWILAARLMPPWDASYTIAGLMLFCLATAKWNDERKTVAAASTLTGFWAGVLSLLNPVTILVVLPWVAMRLWLRRLSLRDAAKYIAVTLLMIALCNVPWLARNYAIWHAPVLRSNFGLTLYSSNNSCAESSLYKNMKSGCYQKTNPVDSEEEIRLLQAVGELRYDHQRTADALRWIRENPSRFRQLTLSRIGEFWFPDPDLYAIWAITLLSIPGIILMAIRRQPLTLFVLTIWVLYPIMYYVVISCDRYRYPILWTSMLPAGYFLAWLLTGPRSRKSEAS